MMLIMGFGHYQVLLQLGYAAMEYLKVTDTKSQARARVIYSCLNIESFVPVFSPSLFSQVLIFDACSACDY